MRRIPLVVSAEELLKVHAGGYLFNTFYEAGVTCRDCNAPISAGYAVCRACNILNARSLARSDGRGLLVYAVGGRQSETLMYGYKAPQGFERHQHIVRALLAVGVFGHSSCLRFLMGTQELRWAVVPSLRGRVGVHPLAQIMRSIVVPGLEVELEAKAAADPRAFEPAHFAVKGRLPADCTTLVIDDTWVGGGHAESAGAALRAAGASRVAILGVARMLNMNWPPNPPFVASRLSVPFSPDRCPWTSTGVCPPGA